MPFRGAVAWGKDRARNVEKRRKRRRDLNTAACVQGLRSPEYPQVWGPCEASASQGSINGHKRPF
jgi:hypothetical protein